MVWKIHVLVHILSRYLLGIELAEKTHALNCTIAEEKPATLNLVKATTETSLFWLL